MFKFGGFCWISVLYHDIVSPPFVPPPPLSCVMKKIPAPWN